MKTTFLNKRVTLLFIGIVFLLHSCGKREDWSDLSFDLLKNEQEETFENLQPYALPGMSDQPVVLTLLDAKSKSSKAYSEAIQKSCDYTKLPFRATDIDSWNTQPSIAESVRVVMIHNTKRVTEAGIPVLLDFVLRGGTVYVPFAVEDHRFAFLLGFQSRANWETDTTSKGWHYTTPVFPGMTGKKIGKEIPLFGFTSDNFSPSIKILATAANNPKYPTIIENPIGKGRVIFYNTSFDFTKIDRGFLFVGILKGIEGVPYSVANSCTLFLDDFPAPQYDIKAEPVLTEMNKTTAEFVSDVWWPDMRKLAKEFDIPYAAMLTFDYRNKIVPPFTLDQWNLLKTNKRDKVESLSDWLVDDVKNNGHEMAFHGYNHVSLTKKLWANPKFIPMAINTVKKKWEINNYGRFPTTYVPPSNIIDPTGLKLLKESMPSLQFMCSLYLGEKPVGGDREFDFDPYEKQFFNYPRISSGFYFSEDEEYTIQSLYLITGIWNHFVHPDDIFQIPATADKTSGGYSLRNQKAYGWRKSVNSDKAIFPEFRKFIINFKKHYPLLRFTDGRTGGKLVWSWRASQMKHESNGGVYAVKATTSYAQPQNYWSLFSEQNHVGVYSNSLKSKGYTVHQTPILNGYLLSVATPKQEISLPDLFPKSTLSSVAFAKVKNEVMMAYQTFQKELRDYQSGKYWDDLQIAQEIAYRKAFRKRLSNSREIDSVQWNKYAKMLSWEEKGKEVWDFYSQHLQQYPSVNNVMYSAELDRQIGYLHDTDKEKWMWEQLKVKPDSVALWKEYIANFDVEAFEPKIRMALQTVARLEPTTAHKMAYIQHLLDVDPVAAQKEIMTLTPSAEWTELADTIVWMYADEENYTAALAWADYAKEIGFAQKMNWLLETRQYKLVEPFYKKYIAKNPNDQEAKSLMVSYYHDQGQFKESWIVANGMNESPEKETVRKMLNTDVPYEKTELQQDLMTNHSALFYPQVLKKLQKELRLNFGDFVEFNSSMETNQKDPAILKNLFSYNRYDRKNRIHSFGIAYNEYYKLEFVDEIYTSNIFNYTVGLEYKFTTAVVDGKPQYWARGRFEMDRFSNGFVQGGVGFNHGKEKSYKTLDLSFFPAETSGGLNEKIYNFQLRGYHDRHFFNRIEASLNFEANYYTDGLLTRTLVERTPDPRESDVMRTVVTELPDGSLLFEEFDDAFNAELTVRFVWDNRNVRKFKILPFIETHGYWGSRDLAVGFPYWMLKDRFYTGGGVGLEFGTDNFNINVEGGIFHDTFSSDFKRLTSLMSYQLMDFTAFTINFELYEQDKFYSNNVMLGIKHNFKPRKKR